MDLKAVGLERDLGNVLTILLTEKKKIITRSKCSKESQGAT